jgi:hypothetical protein
VKVNENSWLLHGTAPTSQDDANAGVAIGR